MPISLQGWVKEAKSDLESGRQLKYTILKSGLKAYNGISHTVTSRYPIGTNIFERDWDALLVLDACRVDAMREIADEYAFISSVDSLLSVGSSSHEWTAKTFTTDHLDQIQRTGYVSSNPFTKKAFVDGERPPYTDTIPFGWPKWNVVSLEDFAFVDFVSKYDSEYRYNMPDANYVTDHAIAMARRKAADKLIIHYFQPHHPYIGRAVQENRDLAPLERDPFEAFANGEVSRDELWGLYLDNLRHVLDGVEILLKNLDAETVVLTADHGELFGEMGAYGHPEGFPHPNLKYVPWVETTANDTGEYFPDINFTESITSETNVDKRLQDLGYL